MPMVCEASYSGETAKFIVMEDNAGNVHITDTNEDRGVTVPANEAERLIQELNDIDAGSFGFEGKDAAKVRFWIIANEYYRREKNAA